MRFGRLLSVALAVLLAVASMQEVLASTIELKYDDGTAEESENGHYGVRFSLAAGWGSATLVKARLFIVTTGSFLVRVYRGDKSLVLSLPQTAFTTGWFDLDLTSYKIVVSGDFYITFEGGAPPTAFVGVDTTPPDSARSYSTGSWTVVPGGNYMIRAFIYSPSVGGVVLPANSLAVLMPYLSVIGLVTTTVAVAVKKRRN